MFTFDFIATIFVPKDTIFIATVITATILVSKPLFIIFFNFLFLPYVSPSPNF